MSKDCPQTAMQIVSRLSPASDCGRGSREDPSALDSYCHWLSSDPDLDLPKTMHRSMRSNKAARDYLRASHRLPFRL